jgi:hypothetical protein
MSDHQSNNTNALGLSRRALLAGASGVGTLAFAAATPARAAIVNTDFRNLPPYGNGTLPAGVRARLIPNINGLTVNILEAGFETRAGLWFYYFTVFPTSPTAGAR